MRHRSALVGLAGLLVAAGVVVTSSAPASAEGGWQPYRTQEEQVVPGAKRCGFDVKSTVEQDFEYKRTVERFPDGSPKQEEYVGPLVVRYTNLETEKSVVRDISGVAMVHYRADGSWTMDMTGRVLVGIGPDDKGQGSVPDKQGIYVAADHARTVLTVAPDGQRTLWSDGKVESLCRTLGG